MFLKLAAKVLSVGQGFLTHAIVVAPEGREWKLPGRQVPGGKRLTWTTLVRRKVVPKGMMYWTEFVRRGREGNLALERLQAETALLKKNELKNKIELKNNR